jgi:hypothetical protein
MNAGISWHSAIVGGIAPVASSLQELFTQISRNIANPESLKLAFPHHFETLLRLADI